MIAFVKAAGVVAVVFLTCGPASAEGWQGAYQSDFDGTWVAKDAKVVINHGSLRVRNETYNSEICALELHVAWPEPKDLKAGASHLLSKTNAASMLKVVPKVADATGSVVISCESQGGWQGVIGLFSAKTFALVEMGDGEGESGGEPKPRLTLFKRQP
jgi:hypothetical protein